MKARRKFTRICARCGRQYETSSDRSRYCSAKCKQASYRIRRDRDRVTTNG